MFSQLNVLVVGKGGREQALYEKIRNSPLVRAVICAPGHMGTPAHNRRAVEATDFPRLLQLCKDEDIGLVVVGPEEPLCAGLVDYLAHHGVKAFGPDLIGTKLEASKVGMKRKCARLGIPTAEFDFSGEYKVSQKSIERMGGELVVKADGLCAGKGVVVANTVDEALAAARMCQVEKKFGQAGERILIERKLAGNECSMMVLADGTPECIVLPVARDYKLALEGNRGENTGGMGAYTPLPDVDSAVLLRIKSEIIQPFLKFYAEIGHPFKGVFYAGVMLTAEGPMLLEVNVRFGDPETQAVLPLVKSDILPYLLAATEYGGFAKLPQLELNPGAAVCVVVADREYPVQGKRLMSVVGTGNTHVAARTDAYARIEDLREQGVITDEMRWRRDIAVNA